MVRGSDPCQGVTVFCGIDSQVNETNFRDRISSDARNIAAEEGFHAEDHPIYKNFKETIWVSDARQTSENMLIRTRLSCE